MLGSAPRLHQSQRRIGKSLVEILNVRQMEKKNLSGLLQNFSIHCRGGDQREPFVDVHVQNAGTSVDRIDRHNGGGFRRINQENTLFSVQRQFSC